MFPELKDGDIVFFKKYIKDKSLLKVGQLVIIYHPLREIKLIKRIKSVNKSCIEVSGDNIYFSNDSKRFGFINDQKVIGIVTSKVTIPNFINLLRKKNSSAFLEPK